MLFPLPATSPISPGGVLLIGVAILAFSFIFIFILYLTFAVQLFFFLSPSPKQRAGWLEIHALFLLPPLSSVSCLCFFFFFSSFSYSFTPISSYMPCHAILPHPHHSLCTLPSCRTVLPIRSVRFCFLFFFSSFILRACIFRWGGRGGLLDAGFPSSVGVG